MKGFYSEKDFFNLLTTNTCVTYTLYRFLTPRGEIKGQVVKAGGGGGGVGGDFASPHYMPLGLPECPVVLLSDWLKASLYVKNCWPDPRSHLARAVHCT